MSDIKLDDDVGDDNPWLDFMFSQVIKLIVLPSENESICFKLLDNSSQFKVAFAELGLLWNLSDIFDALQNVAVRLYGVKNVNVNNAQH